ncbi:MAG: glycosyltransferase family 4 protein [Vicinamibacterales bacterium]
MPLRSVTVVVPGDIETRTGGYGYDRQIIAGLRARGWNVNLIGLPGLYPFPTHDEQQHAAVAFASLPDDTLVVVDGLAFGVLPDVSRREAHRLRLVALVHHPLGLETGLHPMTAQLLLAAERDALASARGVVVTSRRTVDAVEELGVARADVVVVEPGTEPADPSEGSNGGPTRLLCVATLTPRKGHATLVDALERLVHLEWRLTCVGSIERDSEYATALMQRIASGPLSERIEFAGELAGAELDAAYRRADLFVLPTHYEGYGMVIAEALAHGLPVISTPTGAIPELIGEHAGALVPPGDAAGLSATIERALCSPDVLRAWRIGAAQRRSLLPTWGDAAARMEAALVRFASR